MTSGTIDNIKNGTLADFYGNAATLHDLELTYSFLQRMAGNENSKDKIVDLKNSYYKSFSDWDELNYMQFLINYEEIKRLNSYPNFYPELISLFNKFKNTDIATNTVIEEYALDNRGGEMSVFDDDYWKEILEEYRKSSLYIFQPNLFGQNFLMLTIKAKEEHKERKQAALEALLNDVNIDDTSFAIANLIGRLQITDEDQIKWLNHYTNRTEVLSIIDFLDKNLSRRTNRSVVLNFALEAIEALTNGAEVDFDNRVINSLTGKALCVFNKLKELDLYKSTVQKFEDSNTYDLFVQLQFGQCNNSNDEACTDPIALDVGIIYINLQNEGNNNLELASTILHEAIHAEIYRYVDNYNITGENIQTMDIDRILELYFYYKSNGDPIYADANAQHQYMAENYVIPIAAAIRELDENSYPLEHYLMYGWEGLETQAEQGYYDNNGQFQQLTRSDLNDLKAKRTIVNNNSSFNTNSCQ